MLRARFQSFTGRRRPWLAALAFGLLLAAVAVGLQVLLIPVTGQIAPFALVFLAVMASTIVAGWPAGIACSLAGVTLAALLLVEDFGTFPTGSLALGALVVASISQWLLVGIIALYQRRVDDAARERERQLAARDVLVAELNHRVKNTLAIVQSIAQQSIGDHAAPERVRLFERRLQALSAAHDLLTERDWGGVEIRDLVQAATGPFVGGDSQVVATGPNLTLPPSAAVNLALVFHELSTNSVKHGALGQGGRVMLAWTNDTAAGFKLEWREAGGPPVAPPSRTGFGTRLITRGVAAQFGATAELLFPPEGFTYRFAGPFRPDLETSKTGEQA